MEFNIGDQIYSYNVNTPSLTSRITSGVVLDFDLDSASLIRFYRVKFDYDERDGWVPVKRAYHTKAAAGRALRKEFSKQSRIAIENQLAVISNAFAEIARIQTLERKMEESGGDHQL